MAGKQYVWFDGKFVEYDKAQVPVLTHSLQYGSGIFDGLRAYKTAKGTAVFRLKDHVKRFLNSAKVYGMDLGFDEAEICDSILATVKKNGLVECYIRPFAFYNDARIGLDVTGKKVSTVIAAVPFGNYFEKKGVGISCKVSSWQRINSAILPPQAKASGNYLNSILASTEAKNAGCDEAILLSGSGHVAEGPGENIFLVEASSIVTPSKSEDILPGITRDSIIKIAESLGLDVQERIVHREELYLGSEVFFTGTAAELTPIVRIDSRKIGTGRVGPIVKLLSYNFTQAVQGKNTDFEDWLTFVD